MSTVSTKWVLCVSTTVIVSVNILNSLLLMGGIGTAVAEAVALPAVCVPRDLFGCSEVVLPGNKKVNFLWVRTMSGSINISFVGLKFMFTLLVAQL